MLLLSACGKAPPAPPKPAFGATVISGPFEAKKIGDPRLRRLFLDLRGEHGEQAGDALVEIGRSVVPLLLWALHDDWHRSLAIELLGRIGRRDATAARALLPLLRSRDALAREAGALCLDLTGPHGEVAADELIALLFDEQPAVRQAARQTLQSFARQTRDAALRRKIDAAKSGK